MNWRKLILGGLLLPLRLYFQPTAFVAEVAALAPELHRNYSLWQARHKWHEAEFSRAILLLRGQLLISLLWIPAIAVIIEGLGLRVNWVGVAFGVALSVALSVAFGVAFGVVGSIALGVAFSFAFGFAFNFAGDFTREVPFGVALGVALGVVLGVVLGVAREVPFGVVRCVAFGVVGSIAHGVAGSFSFGVAVGVAGSVGFMVSYLLIFTHSLIYPMQVLLSALGWLAKWFTSTDFQRKSWQVMPVRWDETILLPLPGLTGQLKQLYDDDAEFGLNAIDEVANHQFRWPAAYYALADIALDEARQVKSLPTLANYKTDQGWLDWREGWDDETQSCLRQLRAISDEVASALLADSPANKLRRLSDAQKLFEPLRRSTGQMRTIVTQWETLLVAEQQATQAAQAGNEPITQVYFKGGKPIQPDDLNEADNPFKGRRALAQQLEEALGQEERTSLLLLGTRRIGKSSLLLHLPRRLGHAIIPAFINLQDEKFSGKDAASFFISFAEKLGEQVRRNVERYQRDPLRLPTLDREAIRRDPFPVFGKWLDAVERSLGKRTLLLCLDEFEQLEESIAAGRMDKRILDLLRNIIQYRRRITLLLSGVHYLDELPPHWASALVNTQILPISFLDEPDARELIVQPVRSFPPDIYEPATVESLLALTHCQPYLIQLLCGLLVEHCNALILKGERPRPPAVSIPPTDLDEVIPLALQQGEAYFSDLWKSRTGSDLARRVLERLAFVEGETATSEELKALAQSEEELRAALQGLMRREIVARQSEGNGFRYRITVPLVAHYVRKMRDAI